MLNIQFTDFEVKKVMNLAYESLRLINGFIQVKWLTIAEHYAV
jgi:hypothetical protein